MPALLKYESVKKEKVNFKTSKTCKQNSFLSYESLMSKHLFCQWHYNELKSVWKTNSNKLINYFHSQ